MSLLEIRLLLLVLLDVGSPVTGDVVVGAPGANPVMIRSISWILASKAASLLLSDVWLLLLLPLLLDPLTWLSASAKLESNSTRRSILLLLNCCLTHY